MIKKTLRIALLSTPVEYGGAEKVVISLIENIDSEMYELVPIIFTRNDQAENNFVKHLKRLKKEYHEIPVNNYKFKYLNPLINLLNVYGLLKRKRFNLIHTHGYRADILGCFTSKLIGVPIISTCHGYISGNINLITYNKLDQIALKLFDTVITVSKKIKNELIKSKVKASKIKVIPNAVPTVPENTTAIQKDRDEFRRLFGLDPNSFIVGYVGRLSEEKGVKYLIEATSVLTEFDIPFQVLLIGDGPSRDGLEALVKKRGVERIVIFTGFQSNVENLISNIDALVLPSLTEGTPLALLEAMSYGVPVVASAVGEVPNIIDSGKNGILVSPAIPGKIAEALLTLYRDKNFRLKISKNAKETIQSRYNVNDWIKKIESIYTETIRKRNLRGKS